MEIVWSELARSCIKEISDFIGHDSSNRAFDFLERLVLSTDRLIAFPLSGTVVPENSAFRQIVYDGYRIIYRPVSKGIEIVTIISPGQLFSPKSKKEKKKKK